ncbi:hypothetical protein Tco_0768330 [Tanacetum coccineum]
MRLKTDIKPKEATFQVVLDALTLTPFYQAFLITVEVPAIYMQEFWATDNSLKTFHWNKKSSLSLEILGTLATSPSHRCECQLLTSIMERICYRHQQVLKWKRNWNGQDSSIPCSNPLGHKDTQVYGPLLPKHLTNQVMLESKAYQTYYDFASGEKAPKQKYIRKKADLDTSPKKKPIQPTKAKQLKLATKRSKKDFHMSHASGSDDGVDIQSKVSDKQQKKTSGTDEGTDTEDEDDNDDNGDSNDLEDDNDNERTESNKDEFLDLKLTNVDQTEHEEEEYDDEFYEEEEENINDEETTYDDEDDEADEPIQSSPVSSDFTSKLLNLKNPSPADNEISSLMDTSDRHAMKITKNTSGFTTSIPPPPRFLNPLQQEATPTPTPITSKTTTSLHALLDFASVFKINERVFNLEKDVSEIKQVDHYAQALSSIPAIVDRYIDNKLGKAINKAILAHNLDCRQEAQDEKNAYIQLVDMSMRALIKEEVNT